MSFEAVLIVGIWSLFTLTVFEPAFRFHGDHERDLRFATLLVQHGLWPDSTPAISPTPFELGPLLYLLMAPLVAVSSDPFVVRGGFVLLGSAALLLLHGLFRRLVSRRAAALALMAACTSTFTYEAFSQLWHSTLLALPVVLFLRWAHDAQERPSRAVLAAVAAAVALQLHATAVVYPALLLVLAFRLRHQPWVLLRGVLAFLAALSPFLLTLIHTLSRGALSDARGATHGWQPAEPLSVVSFVVDNVHPLWGDVLGPALTWPLVVLAGVGVVAATRTPFGRLLLCNVALGLVVEWALLGNQIAHRYLHANLWAFFVLIALGAHSALERLPARPSAWALGALGASLAVEAALTEVPRSATRGWLNASEQRAVAAVVAEALPVSESDMEHQVHGLYFGEPMGFRHWHSLYANASAAARPEHLLVVPSDLALPLYGQPTGKRYVVHGHGREIAVVPYVPWRGPLELGGPAAEQLATRWRRASGARGRAGSALHTVSTQATRAGTMTLAIADGRRCRVTAALDGRTVETRSLATPAYEWLRFVTIALDGAGRLQVSLGPCPPPAFVDLF